MTLSHTLVYHPMCCCDERHTHQPILVGAYPHLYTSRGQTLIEYREASKRYSDEGGITSADDRILHCCLDFAERLGSASKPAAEGRLQRLILLSNDIMLRNKVWMLRN